MLPVKMDSMRDFDKDQNMAYDDTYDSIEFRCFEAVIASHCPLHELETDYVCTVK